MILWVSQKYCVYVVWRLFNDIQIDSDKLNVKKKNYITPTLLYKHSTYRYNFIFITIRKRLV